MSAESTGSEHILSTKSAFVKKECPDYTPNLVAPVRPSSQSPFHGAA